MALDALPINCKHCQAKSSITRAQLQPGARLRCASCGHDGGPLDAEAVDQILGAWDQLDRAHDLLVKR